MVPLLVWLQVFSAAELKSLSVRERMALRHLLEADSTGQKVDSFLIAQGFWGASWAFSRIGPRYRLEGVTIESDSVKALFFYKRFQRSWKGEVLRTDLIQALTEDALYELGRAGYLYASVECREFRCDSAGRCRVYLQIFPGERVILDTVFIRGRWPAPLGVFYRVTGLWPGRPLSREAWEDLATRLARSSYATVVDTPRLWLFPGLAWVEVRVRPQQNNRIEGALGLASDPLRPGKVQLIGDLKAQLHSPLRLGENLQIAYSQLIGNSQRLRVRGEFPYLLRGLVGIEGFFNLLRQDTSFLLREGGTQISYRLTSVHTLLGGIEASSSRLLSTAAYRQRVWPPPPNLDYRRRGIKLGWRLDTRDNPLNPSRGWFVEVWGTQGLRGYLPNPGLAALDYSRLPATRSYQEAQMVVGRYWPVGRRFTLWTQGRGYRYWVESFFENELRRWGGPTDLRGFPENSLPAYEVGQATLELRLRLGVADYLACFGESGIVGLYPLRQKTFQAIGFALQAQLNVGTLRITFAMGRLLPAPFEPRRTLVALEWLSRF